MTFNDTLDFSPSIEKLERQTRPYHVLLSKYLRASRTFELYEKIAQMHHLESRLIPFELPADNLDETERTLGGVGRNLDKAGSTLGDSGRDLDKAGSTLGDSGRDLDGADRSLSSLIRLMRRDSNFRSILVSDPYKVKIQSVIDVVAASARACGAVNVVYKEDVIVGENFDGLAFRRGAVEIEGIDFRDKRMVFLGCGGVSSAVAVQLAPELEKIGLIDQEDAKANQLKRLLLQSNPSLNVEIISPSGVYDFSQFDYVYNGTGLGKHDSRSPVSPGCVTNSHGVAFDANYTPAMTPFLQFMSERGYRTVNGLSHMLMCTTAHLARVTGSGPAHLTGRDNPLVTFARVKEAFDSISVNLRGA